jgi:hypothetical protein
MTPGAGDWLCWPRFDSDAFRDCAWYERAGRCWELVRNAASNRHFHFKRI